MIFLLSVSISKFNNYVLYILFLAWYLTRRKDNTLSDVLDVVMVYSYLHGDSKFAKNIQSSTALIEDVDIAEWKISQAHQLKLIRAYIEFA